MKNLVPIMPNSGLELATIRNIIKSGAMGVTTKELMESTGATRPAATVERLRAKGWKIETLWQEGNNRYGDKTRYGIYLIPSELLSGYEKMFSSRFSNYFNGLANTICKK